jgi:hypothetical protein
LVLGDYWCGMIKESLTFDTALRSLWSQTHAQRLLMSRCDVFDGDTGHARDSQESRGEG